MLNSRLLFTTLASCTILAAPVMADTATTAPAVSGDPKAAVTRGEFSALLKETLLNDPTILMEVVEKMQAAQEEEMQKKAREGLVKYKDQIYNDKASPFVGPADADVTLVEFFDYHCGYCKQAIVTLSKLIESDKKLKIIFKEFPILSEDSRYGAKAALAVHRIAKNKYFDFHRALYGVKGTITEDVIVREAKALGIDADKMKAEMANPEIEKVLKANRELGGNLGVRGTPAIILGDKLYPGAIPLETLQKFIADIRAEKKGDKKPDAKK